MQRISATAKTTKARKKSPIAEPISLPKIVGYGIPGIPFPDPNSVQLLARRSQIYEIARVTRATYNSPTRLPENKKTPRIKPTKAPATIAIRRSFPMSVLVDFVVTRPTT